jgi:chromosome partitioning protein
MIVVSIAQIKGGCGKTTLAMALASGALSEGMKVHIFDADVDQQIMSWPADVASAEWTGIDEKPAWPSNLQVELPPDDMAAMLERLEQLEEHGTDIVLIDTKPGTRTDTENLVLISDVVLIPAKPGLAEWQLVFSTLTWMNELHKSIEEGEHFPMVRTALLDVSKKIMDAAAGENSLDTLPKIDATVLSNLLQTPFLGNMIPTSKYFEQFRHWGPLGYAAEVHRQQKRGMIAANLEDLTGICAAMVNELVEATKGAEQ